MIRLIVELTISMLLVVLAGDLLYLYYAGGWYDPSKIIELTEVTLLYAIAVLGIGYFVWRSYKSDKRGADNAED